LSYRPNAPLPEFIRVVFRRKNGAGAAPVLLDSYSASL